MGFTSENKPEKQITMGILAHVDAGKTTLSEGILYTCKAIRKLGRVDHQDAFLDTNTLERNRGITIFSKQAKFVLGDFDHDGVVCDDDYAYLMDFVMNSFDGYISYKDVSDKMAFEVNTTAVDLNMDGVLDIRDAIAWNKLS